MLNVEEERRTLNTRNWQHVICQHPRTTQPTKNENDGDDDYFRSKYQSVLIEFK
jgi:hypothetical protein